MLHFFRKYQKVLFIVTTTVVVASFAFFGSYSAFQTPQKAPDPLLFTTKRGKSVYAQEFKHLCSFLSSEEGSGISRSVVDENFFNMGWISENLLATNVATHLVEKYSDRFTSYLDEQLPREKNFQPYINYKLPSMSAQTVWQLVCPEVNSGLESLKECQNGKEAFEIKAKLYQAQRNFPPQMLQRTLFYQAQSQPELGFDERLLRADLALFHYHNLDEWFGEEFVKACAYLLIDFAEQAESLGIKISDAEVQREILLHAKEKFESLDSQSKQQLGSAWALARFYSQHQGMDEQQFLHLMKRVLLSQRYLEAMSQAPFVDTYTLDLYHSFAFEYATLNIKQLPEALRFKDEKQWAQFEAYLKATTDYTQQEFPKKELSKESIREKAPELIGKEYALYIGHVKKSQLAGRIGIKEMWDWELATENRLQIEKEFPDLARSTTSWEQTLDSLSPARRKKLDEMARLAILNEHPEWIEEAFQETLMDEKPLFFSASYTTKEPLLEGIADLDALVKVLEEQEEVTLYTQDSENYYRFLRRGALQEERILTFQEALSRGRLNALTEKLEGEKLVASLREYYPGDENALYGRFRSLFQQGEEISDYFAQFSPLSKRVTLSRADTQGLDANAILSEEIGVVSAVLTDRHKGAYQYEILDHQIDQSPPVKRLYRAQDLLNSELRKIVLKDLVTNSELPSA